MNERAAHIATLASAAEPDDRIGALLSEIAALSQDDIGQILKVQQESRQRFGEIAIALGLASSLEVQDALARQFGYPYQRARKSNAASLIHAAGAPFSPGLEALRLLRSELRVRWFSQGQKVLTVACVDQEESSNVLAANLAVSFSQLGLRTLVVDANLRRPILGQLFGLGARLGLSDVLARRASLKQICAVDDLPHLFVLPAGTPPPNPQELLSRMTSSKLLKTLEEAFDVVLLAAPEYATYKADVVAVMTASRGALLAVSQDKTRLSDLHAMREHLAGMGIAIVGAALTRAANAGGRYGM